MLEVNKILTDLCACSSHLELKSFRQLAFLEEANNGRPYGVFFFFTQSQQYKPGGLNRYHVCIFTGLSVIKF